MNRLNTHSEEQEQQKLYGTLAMAYVCGGILILCYGYIGVKSVLIKEKRWIALICAILLISLSSFIASSQFDN
jgi:hypothetical protein